MKSTRFAMLMFIGMVVAAVVSACANSNGGQPRPGTAEGSHVLTIEVEGPGAVAVPELGETCRDSCTVRVGAGVDLDLQAQPDSGKGFVRWEQGCAGNGGCTVRMDADATVRAVFADHVLALDLQGDGNGTVRIVPPDVNCSEDCSVVFPSAMNASLTVTLAEGSSVKGWGGECSGTGTSRQCQLAIQARTDVTLTLINPPVANSDSYSVEEGSTLTVPASDGVLSNDKDSGGESLTAVLVSSTEKGTLDFGSDGSFTYQPDAGASGGDSFTYRARDESGNLSGPVGVSLMINAKDRFPLTVEVADGGTVTSSPGGIDCPGGPCSDGFVEGQSVTLTAKADQGWQFDGWGGDCSGASGDTCPVQMGGKRTVTANFSPMLVFLTYNKAGDGAGTVTFQPPSEACTSSCDKPYGYGDEVTLTAEAGEQSEFAGWSGCDAEGPVCVLQMNGSQTVSATFQEAAAPARYNLEVSVSGEGSVSSEDGGIACPGDCQEPYDENDHVTLTANTTGGSTFSGWGGACTGSEGDTCTLIMNSSKTVTADFASAPALNQASVTLAGGGSGRATSQPPGIDCVSGGDPAKCSESYEKGTKLSLTAAADEGSEFAGWSKPCSDQGEVCEFKLSKDENVTATFEPLSWLVEVDPKPAGGTITSDGGAIDCGETGSKCSAEYQHGTDLFLTATPAPEHEFDSWSGACAGQEGTSCSLKITENEVMSAAFASSVGDSTEEGSTDGGAGDSSGDTSGDASGSGTASPASAG